MRIVRQLPVVIGALVIGLAVATATPGAPPHPGAIVGEDESIHYAEHRAHQHDRIAFEPGGKVAVPFRPRPGDARLVGGQRPRPLPAGRRSGADLLYGTSGDGPDAAVTTGGAEPVGGTPRAAASPTGLRSEVFGFLPYWQVNSSSLRLDYRGLSTIAYFGLTASQDGHLIRRNANGTANVGWAGWTSSKMTSIINAAHTNGTRVVLGVGRFSWDAAQTAATRALLSSATARRTLVAEIATAVRDRGVDGVNLDFEPIPDGQAQNFVTFVRELRRALDQQAAGYQLTFDATRLKWLVNYDIRALTAPGAADAVFVMGYDYRIGGASHAGSLAPLRRRVAPTPSPSPTASVNLSPSPSAPPPPPDLTDDLTTTLDAYLALTTPDKIILGLPYYGRAWSTETDQLGSPTRPRGSVYGTSASVLYYNAVSTAAQHGRRYDTVEQTAWTRYTYRYCSSCPSTWRQVYYDDRQSLSVKYDLVLSRGLRGTGMWALGYDGTRTELYDLLRAKFQVADTTPPVAAPPDTRFIASSTLGSSTVPLRIAWSARDNATGVAALQLQQSTDAGTWTGVTLPTASATAISRSVSMGHAYRFRVRAKDGAGNWGSWAYGPTFAVIRSPETSTAIRYAGPWVREPQAGADGGYVRYTSMPDAYARFSFTGRAVSWVAPRGAGSGTATVIVDGAPTTVNLHSSVTAPRKLVFTMAWADAAPRTLEIRAAGTPGHPRVDIDSFVVLR